MEPYYTNWETKWHAEGGKDINNPKIPLSYVAKVGQLLWGAAPPANTMKKRKVTNPRKRLPDTNLLPPDLFEEQ